MRRGVATGPQARDQAPAGSAAVTHDAGQVAQVLRQGGRLLGA